MAMICAAEANKKATQQSEAAERRHGRGSSRGPRRGMSLGNDELDEIVIARALAAAQARPMKPVQKHDESDLCAASTAEPSSAEPSPVLACITSETDVWPSLREAVESGWDFCSEGGSDIDEELWEDLPGPALAVEGLDSPSMKIGKWLLVQETEPESSKPESAEAASKATFADLLKKKGETADMVPPAAGTAMPPMRYAPMQRRPGIAKDDVDEDEQSELYSTQLHGHKHHRASRNSKQQRKTAERVKRRFAQSCQNRGCEEGA